MRGWPSVLLSVLIVTAALLIQGQSLLAAQNKPMIATRIVYLGKQYDEPDPLSLVEKILTDNGIQGAQFANKENNNTGLFLNHKYKLIEALLPFDGDIVAKAREIFSAGDFLIIADLEPEDLLKVSDLAEAKDAIIFNIRSSDNSLREENCRANVFHTPPSWAARADALGQYLVWKKWRRWFLIKGKRREDEQLALSMKRAAKRFGAKVVEERIYRFEAGGRRVETGHQQIQTQMPMVTRSAADHDVIMVADTGEQFGEYLPYRTSEPSPVVGTHGLVAVTWHRSFEQWGSMSMQRAFEKFAKRIMTERDYSAWVAVRSIGEAVTRGGKNDAASVSAYLLSDKFTFGGFKGVGLTFRRWNNQLRQPILVSSARSLVSLSPQEGFLHQNFLTDTLGFDEPETKCKMKR